MNNRICHKSMLSVVKAAAGLLLFVSSGWAGVFDCENEMQVNPVFGNRVPLTEDDAKKKGWTEMGSFTSQFHSEMGLWKICQKLAMLPGAAAAKLKIQLEHIAAPEFSSSAQLQDVSDVLDSVLGINHKYISPDGKHEAVYDSDTGRLVNQGKYQGTYNKHSPEGIVESTKHLWTSVGAHIYCVIADDYVWEPTKECFVVAENGQEIDVACDSGDGSLKRGETGNNLAGSDESGTQVETFPWQTQPAFPTRETGGDSRVPVAQTPVAPTYETIDYRGLKRWGTDLLNNAYSQASGMADAEGFGAEYRSRAAPIVNQGLNYIQSIPDEVQVPAGQ